MLQGKIDNGLLRVLKELNAEKKFSNKSETFYMKRKELYENSVKEYLAFIKRYGLRKEPIDLNKEIQKEEFTNYFATPELIGYMEQILISTESLTSSIRLDIEFFIDRHAFDTELFENINTDIKKIHKLSHLKLLTPSKEINRSEILWTIAEI